MPANSPATAEDLLDALLYIRHEARDAYLYTEEGPAKRQWARIMQRIDETTARGIENG